MFFILPRFTSTNFSSTVMTTQTIILKVVICLTVASTTLSLPVASSQLTEEDQSPLQEHSVRKRSESKPCNSKGVVGSEPRTEGLVVNEVLVHVPLLPGQECPEGSMIDHMGGCRRPFLPGVGGRKDPMPGIRHEPVDPPPEVESPPSTTPPVETSSSTTSTTPAPEESSSSTSCAEGDLKKDTEEPPPEDSTPDAI
ncbi:uncharacterized protein LOC143021064 [Oratosquilla oratoria]|uniref:uncharacterized protein LOC143021064 n=1 Tax=Oratosquilla oratoria TaxID=337810 RepID=UPI003F7727F1